MKTRRQLEDEISDLREALEEIYDAVAEALGFEDEDEENDAQEMRRSARLTTPEPDGGGPPRR